MKQLNALLASVAVLKQKAYNMHWNVRGIDFMPYHQLTQQLFEGLDDLFDQIAEKVAQQGGTPLSTLADYVKESKIKEVKPKHFKSKEVVEIIAADLEILAKQAEEVKTNQWTQPLLDEVFLFVDKQRWFFDSSK